MAYSQSSPAEHQYERRVGFALAFGIFSLPFIFAWFVLGKGYSTTARIVSFGWLLFIGIIVIMQSGKEEAAPAPTPTPVQAEVKPEEPEVKAWLPEGFVPVSAIASSSNIKAGFTWTQAPESACAFSTACIGMTIIPAKACDMLYVNLSVENAAGDNVGFANALTTNVAKNQRALMVFQSGDEGASKFKLQEVKCRR